MPHKQDMTWWETWSEELKKVLMLRYGSNVFPEIKDYRVFFQEGLTPAEAVIEDEKNA
jgi:hypothetical protein